MRAESRHSEFCNILLDIGYGKYPEINNSHDIEITTALCQVIEDTESLIQSIYEEIHNLNTKDDLWVCERSILAPRNDQVCFLKKIPGHSESSFSINTICLT